MTNNETGKLFGVFSPSGDFFGEYRALTENQAILACHHDAGYDCMQVWLDGDTICFRDDDIRSLIGECWRAV